MAHRIQYEKGGDSMRRVFGDAEAARKYYGRYVHFAVTVRPAGGSRLLDLGCGNGWSSELLHAEGFDVTGLEVTSEAFSRPAADGLRFVVGSAESIPFADGHFDAVSSYQVLEHVPDPAVALLEMVRVTRGGGRILVAGPNLLSPLNTMRQVAGGPWRADREAARNPSGNSKLGAAAITFLNVARLTIRAGSRSPRFLMREPDFRPPARGDSDACFLLNPHDVIAFLSAHGCKLVRNGAPGRPGWTAPLAGGTWVAMEKG